VSKDVSTVSKPAVPHDSVPEPRLVVVGKASKREQARKQLLMYIVRSEARRRGEAPKP
jgi:hypothetical protein